PFCEAGCDFHLNLKNGRVIGVTPQPPKPGRPLCLKGRLALELLYMDEPPPPYRKENGKFVATGWAEALDLEKLLAKISQGRVDVGRS
ncbi:MAG: hypothetical protein H5T99_04305, partial [Moorella sp. (in: Bacteria)]|nr:hypothetical protein [Moorella sp. (in: firmicutes)]